MVADHTLGLFEVKRVKGEVTPATDSGGGHQW
jgi:hypothetical protein